MTFEEFLEAKKEYEEATGQSPEVAILGRLSYIELMASITMAFFEFYTNASNIHPVVYGIKVYEGVLPYGIWFGGPLR